MYRFIIVGILLLGVGLFFFNTRSVNLARDGDSQSSEQISKGSKYQATSKPPSDDIESKDSELITESDELEGYGASTKGAEDDLLLVRNVIEMFNLHIKKRGALPTWGNREIMQALQGDNIYKMRFVRSDFEFLNENGEIVDRWGYPLIFHFVKADYPEVKSRGPDGKLGTSDDVMVTFF